MARGVRCVSKALLPSAGLRWWTEQELAHRQVAQDTLARAISGTLHGLNSAWRFHRVEGPMLVPQSMVNPAYSGDDVFFMERTMMDQRLALRPETTAGTYMAANAMLEQLGAKILPLCVWQVGKSFRVEKSDGASASKLRYNEFTQAEWQCIYRADTKADYRAAVLPVVERAVGWLTGCATRVVPSDRLPSYSVETLDIEVLRGERWTEMCSVSLRTDFVTLTTQHQLLVLEVAVGLDRVVDVAVESGVL